MAGPQWEVVGGAEKGGIVVRAGKELTSAQLPEKLSAGSLLTEVARAGDRLQYRLVRGNGPAEGWVSVRLKDKVLLEPRQAPAAAAAPAPPAPSGSIPQAVPKATPVSPAADFASRLEALREKFPGSVGLEVPPEAHGWSPKDLENYFESGGFIKPQGFSRPAPRPAPSPAQPRAGKAKQDEGPQFSIAEATSLLDRLRHGFAERDFQHRLLRLQNQYPNRKQRGHADGPQYFEAFETLVMTIYMKVLPHYKLTPDWDGVSSMYTMLTTALMHPKVKKQHEELNTLLGLPRDAVLKPSKRTEEVFVYRPAGDGNQPDYPLPTLEDEDGDSAHEFFEEDRGTGELQSRLESTCAWFRVVHRPHVTLRSRPDIKSNPVGTKLFGAKLRGQKVIEGAWLLLHETEAKKLNTPEAWLLCDGTALGLGEMAQRVIS